VGGERRVDGGDVVDGCLHVPAVHGGFVGLASIPEAHVRAPRAEVGARLGRIGSPQRFHELLHALVEPPNQRLTLLLASTMAAFEAAVSDRPGGPAVDAPEMGDDALHRPAGDVGSRRVCGPAASHLTDPLSLGGDDIYVVHGSQVTPP